MTNLHPDLLQEVKVGSALRASYVNSFIRASKQYQQPTKGYSGPDFSIQNRREFEFDELEGLNSIGEAIPPYSVFSINNPGLDFISSEARVTLKKFATGDKFIITNDSHVIPTDVYYQTTLLGPHRKYILKYEGDAPVAGDIMGPVDGSFFISTEGTGLIALTKGNTESNLVWVTTLSIGGGGLMQMGKLVSNLGHMEVGPLVLWQQTGNVTGSITLLPTGDSISVLNVTTTTLRPLVLMQVRYNERFEMPLVFPHEIQECLQPTFTVQTNGLENVNPVTIAAKSRLLFDPSATGSPRIIQFPDTTLIPEGFQVALDVINSDTTTVTLNANPSSAADKIMNPLNRSAAPASSISGLNLALASEQWVLIKTGQVSPLWYNVE